MSCYLETIDRSPNVNPPFCMYYGEDYDCETCKLTKKEKDSFVKEAEKAQEYFMRQSKRKGRKKL